MSIPNILLLLAFSAYYFVWYFSDKNGLTSQIGAAITVGKLPGIEERLRQVYTGIEALDTILVFLTTFFWTLVDGSQPGMMLHSITFCGALGSAWILVTLESWRRGNAWTTAAFPTFFALLAQFYTTFALAAPLYGYLHLKSRAAAVHTPNAENMRLPLIVIEAIPYAFIIGLVAPTALMCAPISKLMTYDLKQICIALWQPCPAYAAGLVVIYYKYARSVYAADTPTTRRQTRRLLPFIYAYAFANSAISHLTTIILSFATVLAPSIFPRSYADKLDPGKVFAMPVPWSVPLPHVSSVGQGARIFLIWDYAIGSIGILIWAVSLYRTAHRAAGVQVYSANLLAKTIILSTLSGPIGAATVLLWQREELFLYASEKLRE